MILWIIGGIVVLSAVLCVVLVVNSGNISKEDREKQARFNHIERLFSASKRSDDD